MWNKYQQQKKQVTTDGGITWVDVIPYEYRKGSLIESNSADCTPNNPDCEIQYRWVDVPTDEETMCWDGNEWSIQKKYYSRDCGNTWIYSGVKQSYQMVTPNSSCCDGNKYICGEEKLTETSLYRFIDTDVIEPIDNIKLDEDGNITIVSPEFTYAHISSFSPRYIDYFTLSKDGKTNTSKIIKYSNSDEYLIQKIIITRFNDDINGIIYLYIGKSASDSFFMKPYINKNKVTIANTVLLQNSSCQLIHSQKILFLNDNIFNDKTIYTINLNIRGKYILADGVYHTLEDFMSWIKNRSFNIEWRTNGYYYTLFDDVSFNVINNNTISVSLCFADAKHGRDWELLNNHFYLYFNDNNSDFKFYLMLNNQFEPTVYGIEQSELIGNTRYDFDLDKLINNYMGHSNSVLGDLPIYNDNFLETIYNGRYNSDVDGVKTIGNIDYYSANTTRHLSAGHHYIYLDQNFIEIITDTGFTLDNGHFVPDNERFKVKVNWISFQSNITSLFNSVNGQYPNLYKNIIEYNMYGPNNPYELYETTVYNVYNNPYYNGTKVINLSNSNTNASFYGFPTFNIYADDLMTYEYEKSSSVCGGKNYPSYPSLCDTQKPSQYCSPVDIIFKINRATKSIGYILSNSRSSASYSSECGDSRRTSRTVLFALYNGKDKTSELVNCSS